MKTLAQLKALYALLTGKTSSAKSIAGVIKEMNDNLEVSIAEDTGVVTISVVAD